MSDKKFSAIVSFSLHLFMLALAIAFKFSPNLQLPEEPIVILNIQNFPKTAPKTTPKKELGTKQQPIPKKVELPKTLIKTPLEKVALPSEKQITKTSFDIDKAIGNNLISPKTDAIKTEIQKKSKVEAETFDDEFLAEFSSLIGTENITTEYLLEGEVLKRELLFKTIPNYPQGVEKNQSVVLSFEVTPEGDVKNVIIKKKANPMMEQVSIEAINQWKFNPILYNQNQLGTITFVYELE